jgi:hypothetical protein
MFQDNNIPLESTVDLLMKVSFKIFCNIILLLQNLTRLEKVVLILLKLTTILLEGFHQKLILLKSIQLTYP